ncbi:probable inactive receptor kinase At4g23740 [Euphorbia lathyris]|uniref:probable inactive receptor kinase At4g23740 n=1 Tax=Euphorbia lathyris TaxID=212925 RepID=UPI003314049D
MNILFIFYATLFFGATMAEPVEDKQALLDFIQNMHYSHIINWSQSSSVCREWTGVTCNIDQTRVIALRLPGAGMEGMIPPNTLSRLSAIQIISLRSNGLSGSFPSDLSKLVNLSSLYLQFNSFSGALPSDFSVWNNLTVVDLSNNRFNGSIPASISNLTHLTSLDLSNNSLSGGIPDIDVPSLQSVNLANNDLTGVLPRSLSRFPSSAFSGNNVSSESALPPPALPLQPPIPQPSRKPNVLSESAILGIVLSGCILGFAVIALMMVCSCSKKSVLPTKLQKDEVVLKRGSSESKDNRLVFFEGCSLAFDLEDLLRASAEVLGKGIFGATYKAAMEDATTLVVKRLTGVPVARKDFEQQMELIGSFKHPNVSELRAYYYSKDEKLTVCDYYEQGSVSALLHGNRGEGRIPLDWETRVKIALGAAKGIAYIHKQNGGKLVHGNIKATNVFLNSEGFGCISDIGLAALMSPMPPPVMRAAGYRAPEVTDSRKATHASDVYSFGVLLLELLTGKSAMNSTGGEEVIHLVRWVHSVVREEWTAEVFDVELLRYPNIEEEMVEMLQIGMNCVVRMPEQRPKMSDVVKMLEEVRRGNTENLPSFETTPTPSATDIASSSAPPQQ